MAKPETVPFDFTRQALASQALLRWAAGDEENGWATLSYGSWADVLIHLMFNASHMALVARAAGHIAKNNRPVTPTDPVMAAVLTNPEAIENMVVGDPEYRQLATKPPLTGGLFSDTYPFWEDKRLGDAGLLYFAAEACCTKILRTARRTNLPPLLPFPLPQPGDLGVPPLVIGALVVVGIAQVAAYAWLASEVSDNIAKVKIEEARATAKADVAIEIAKAQIANGQPVQLPGELLEWGERQKTTSEPWFIPAVGAGIAAVAAAAGYVGYSIGD